jgi:hypothetical protein
MNTETPQSNETDWQDKERSSGKGLLIPLLLAFTPAALVLATLTLKPDRHRALFVVACAISVACCFASSFMLFARRTILAILAGLLFLILNGLIAFAFGCATLDLKF